MTSLGKSYFLLLNNLKLRIREAQLMAAFNVNKGLIMLYWEIGKRIIERQNIEGWGSKVIDKLSKDLTIAFPEMKGFSSRNLKYMRKFAEEYQDISIVQEALAQLTWYHNITLMDKIRKKDIRLWYAAQTIKNGWSRNVLVHQIESSLHSRQGKLISNFSLVLPQKQSELTKAVLKDPYIFDFLSLTEDAQEKDIEEELTRHITKFLLELGVGFAFLGSQYHLEISNHDYYIDLLFYHLKLRSYIVIELKAGEFKPEYTGKLSFYLSAVDDLLRKKEDKPTIGIILCKTKNKIIAEYALKDMAKPIGISEYKIVSAIPEGLKANLPSIGELESELSKFTKRKHLEK